MNGLKAHDLYDRWCTMILGYLCIGHMAQHLELKFEYRNAHDNTEISEYLNIEMHMMIALKPDPYDKTIMIGWEVNGLLDNGYIGYCMYQIGKSRRQNRNNTWRLASRCAMKRTMDWWIMSKKQVRPFGEVGQIKQVVYGLIWLFVHCVLKYSFRSLATVPWNKRKVGKKPTPYWTLSGVSRICKHCIKL